MCENFGFSLEIVIDNDPRKISYCKNLCPAVRLAGFIKDKRADSLRLNIVFWR